MIIIYIFLISLTVTIYLVPRYIVKAYASNLLVIDRYKKNEPEIPTQGAIVVIFVSFITIFFYPVLIRIINLFSKEVEYYDLNPLDLSILVVLLIFSLYGIIDDMIEISWWPKIILPLCFTFPLMINFTPVTLEIPFYGSIMLSEIYLVRSYTGEINLVDVFKILIIPIYVMVVSNLVNMHSGFNGLQSGLSLILLSTLIIKCILDNSVDNLIIFSSILGGILGFLYYNKYPSKIIEGNIGPLVFGACIGTLIIIKSLYFFGVFILLPHIADFLLWLLFYYLSTL